MGVAAGLAEVRARIERAAVGRRTGRVARDPGRRVQDQGPRGGA